MAARVKAMEKRPLEKLQHRTRVPEGGGQGFPCHAQRNHELPDLLPECLAHETTSQARAGADALSGVFSLGARTLLAAGASPNGLTKITWANLGTRKITALDVVNAHSGQISALLREAGGKRAHDLRREAQPEIEAMLADLNLAP